MIWKYCWHTWSKWGKVYYVKALWGNQPAGTTPFQERECKKCGKVEIKEVRR